MARHPFDPVSLLFGMLFCTAGMIVLLGGSLHRDGAWLVPVGLIGLGIALLRPGWRGPRDPSRMT